MNPDAQQHYDRVKAALESEESGALAAALADVHAADIAEIYDLLDDEDRSKLIYSLPARTTAEVIVLLDEAERGDFVDDLDSRELTELVSEMEPDDAADLLGELPEEQREDVLELIPDEQSDKIEELLSYAEDSAGGIMTKDLVALPDQATVGEAITEIRRDPDEDLHYVYVVGDHGKLTGVVPLRRLVLQDKNVPLDSICDREPIVVRVDDDQEKVVYIFSKYDLAAVPVVDAENHLLGRITHDDIMDVIEEEADEDMYRMAGTTPAELESTSVIRAAGIRLSWLVPCLLSMGITAAVMTISQQWFAVHVYTALIVFVPMIGAIGGNCGIQISTIVVRGLATGELASSKFRTAFMRESRIALLMAPVCGATAWIIGRFLLPALLRIAHAPSGADLGRVALAVSTGMTVAILVAATLGMILPFIFRRIGVDPAIASGPIVTTVNDILSVTTFLGLATVIMT